MLGEDDTIPLVRSTDDGEIVETGRQIPVKSRHIQKNGRKRSRHAPDSPLSPSQLEPIPEDSTLPSPASSSRQSSDQSPPTPQNPFDFQSPQQNPEQNSDQNSPGIQPEPGNLEQNPFVLQPLPETDPNLEQNSEQPPPELLTAIKDKQSKHLKNLISISIALVALYFTAAGISIRAEALVHSNIVGACNSTHFSNQHILVILFSAFAFGPAIASLPLLILAFGSLFYSLFRARRMYSASFNFSHTPETQRCQREFFKDLIKEVVGITAATVVIGYLSGDQNNSKDIHQACRGNMYEQAFMFIQFMNDILALLAIGSSFLSLMIGFLVGLFWFFHECTAPSVKDETVVI